MSCMPLECVLFKEIQDGKSANNFAICPIQIKISKYKCPTKHNKLLPSPLIIVYWSDHVTTDINLSLEC